MKSGTTKIIAAYENRFASFDLKLLDMKSDFTLVKGMLGVLLAGVASLVVKTFI